MREGERKARENDVAAALFPSMTKWFIWQSQFRSGGNANETQFTDSVCAVRAIYLEAIKFGRN